MDEFGKDKDTAASGAFEAWGLLELMGRTRLAGKLTEQTIGGCAFIRLDVPELDGTPGYTRFFTQSAIYGMTILSEELAKAMARTLRAKPVQAYELPDPPLPRIMHGLAARPVEVAEEYDDLDEDGDRDDAA